jgi:glycosyltransferase involved in cell wall biosynthesis
MISIIVCSRDPKFGDLHRKNIAKTIGCDYEYVSVDNSDNKYGICAAYNKGVEQAKGDLCVFIHEDCFFMEPGWGAALYSKFEKDPLLGGVGVAGTQYLFSTTPAWIAAGMPFIRGRVIHELRNGEMFVLTIFSWDKADAEVVAFDGLFFAIPKKLFDNIRFDEKTFPGFHFYDLDICMQIRKTHRLLVTWDIMLKHFSGGNMNQVWLDYGKRFLEKYRSVLPVSCVPAGEIPDPARHRGCQSFDLRGKAPLGVIV